MLFRCRPIPTGGRSDAHLVVWQPSRNRLWEFWHLAQGAAGWQAGWGGAMQNVVQPGRLRSRSLARRCDVGGRALPRCRSPVG